MHARENWTGWAVALSAAGSLAVLAALAPVVGGEVGAVLHHAFSAVCHQIPERSPHLAGDPVALCHRCVGILLGLIAGLAAVPMLGARLGAIRSRAQARWLALAAVPTLLDWSATALGLWTNTPLSRSLTGAVLGVTAGVFLGASLLAAPRPSPTPSPG